MFANRDSAENLVLQFEDSDSQPMATGLHPILKYLAIKSDSNWKIHLT
jgi:hypothetical protein